jgi:hypothetical protein
MTAGTVDTIAKLQTLAAGVTGIVTAPTTKYPVALDTASLPAVLTYAGSATTNHSVSCASADGSNLLHGMLHRSARPKHQQSAYPK